MIEIGMTAMRTPDGGFLPAVPLYIKVEDSEKINPTTDKTTYEHMTMPADELQKLFAEKHKIYVRNKRNQTIEAKKKGVPA